MVPAGSRHRCLLTLVVGELVASLETAHEAVGKGALHTKELLDPSAGGFAGGDGEGCDSSAGIPLAPVAVGSATALP